MRNLGLALCLLLGIAPAQAQNFTMPPPAGVVVGGLNVVASCGAQSLNTTSPAFATMDTTGVLCTSAGGGGGGGLSVLDGASFTAGTSHFTPSGGTYNSSIPPLTTGEQGTVALTPNRSFHTLDDNSAATLAAVQAPIPGQPNFTTNIGAVSGVVNVTPTDCSVALTTGASAQNILATSTTRHGFTLVNIDASAGSGEPIWFSFTGTAVAGAIGSYPLSAPTATTFTGLSSYTTPLGFGVNTAVSVIATTSGHKIGCVQW